MPDGPYDWEADDARRRRERSEHWYRQADNTPLLAGQFWALWDAHLADHHALVERVERNEQRLVEERGKEFVRDLWAAFWGKAFVIGLAVLSAYFLANYANGLRFP